MSKLGPHVINATDAALRWAGRAPIVKSLDRPNVFSVARNDSIKVFRHYFGDQKLQEPLGTAKAVIGALAGYRDPRLYVELWNEAHPTVDQLKQAVAYCHAQGVKVAGGSWGTGDYNRAEFDIAVAAGCDLIAIHCYFGNQGFSPWHALRYRTFWKPGDPPILITECGRDAVEGGQAGWKKSGVDADVYRAELIAYDAEISKDAYVLGATVFTAGAGGNDWDAFDTDSFSDKLPGGTTMPVYSSPNHGSKRTKTLGVVLHSTRGGSAGPASEFTSTVAWFDSPASQVSAHTVVGPGGQVHLSVDPDLIAWHARTYNQTHLGIELVQAKHGDAIGGDVLDAAAKVVAGWHATYGFPLILDVAAGLAQHKDIPPGIADGKTDIDLPFDQAAFLGRVRALVLPPALNVVDLSVFPDWAKARLANKQDFRGPSGLADFKAHLKGIGAPDDPSRYGWPA